MNIKFAYSKSVVSLVVDIYGRQSEMHKKVLNGEFISKIVKADIKKKGKVNRGTYNYKAKKELFKYARTEETQYELALQPEQDLLTND